MATSGEELLLDTSAAVAFLLRSHEAHGVVHATVRGATLGLSGHATFETFAVLTRLPAPARVSARTAARMIEHNFPASRHLSADGAAAVVPRLGGSGVAGGSVYDALVAATALEHGRTLVTRDRRALPTYALLGADVLLVEG